MATVAADPAVEFETVIGLEVHAQMITRSKMFCGCDAEAFTPPPNTHVCGVCAGMPGVLPVINGAAVRQAVRVALALHGTVQLQSKFDRKNYTYPDLPKGYQISQYDLPVSLGGYLSYVVDGEERRAGITRVHMEEDTGRSSHRTRMDGSHYSLIDLNRAGVPLLEIVGEPDLRSPDEARHYLTTMRQLLRYIGASTGDMEKGALRCDANVSLRPRGSSTFGAKVEIKNVNSFRGVYRALAYEVERQAGILRAGGTIAQETRGWSDVQGVTLGQRSKEQAHDYRYFPEPDLPPLVLTPAFVDECRASLPELPDDRRARYLHDYGLHVADAGSLTESVRIAGYFEAIVGEDANRARPAAATILNDVFTLRADREEAITVAPPPDAMRDLLALVEAGTISRTAAKEVFAAMATGGESPAAAVARLGLAQVSDESALMGYVDAAIAANPKAAADYRGGKQTAINALLGAVMRQAKSANSAVVRELLAKRLTETA